MISLILIPLISGVFILALRRNFARIQGIIASIAALFNFITAILLFKTNAVYALPWDIFGIECSLRLYHFSAFTILASAFFGFLICLYSISFLRDKNYAGQFYAYLLLSLFFVNSAVLSDNLGFLFFFWEGLQIMLFAMIAIGGRDSYKTATKAFIIEGVAGLFIMFGIGIIWKLTGTLEISKINISLGGLASAAFIFVMIGAVSKGGSMPFHSWIPNAAKDAPLPFMAFLPASLDKLLGIYFLTRICLDMFQLTSSSWISTLLMVVGAVTIILAVMMALIQKEYKKLLSYHAISQMGYMILGIGTALPVGIIGGIFHMLNNALYKSCLFLTGGAVEKQAGTTDLEKLGGIGLKMPVTFFCFIICAVSISGVPPFNGFFSKELVYDAALKRGLVFYLAAVIGSFFTAASFLKLGHAAFLGKLNDNNKQIKEASPFMLAPMVIIAFVCIIFGIFNFIPINSLIQPVLGGHTTENFSGMPANIILVIITLLVLAGAVLNHLYGVKKTGSGLRAVDHIHYAPVLRKAYDRAEKGYLDPYDIVLNIISRLSHALWSIDRGIDWLYSNLSVRISYALSYAIRKAHTGNCVLYIVWSILGAVLVLMYMVFKV